MKSRLYEGLAGGFLLAMWVLAAEVIPTLPARIPTHFAWNGVADGSGPPSTLWLLPAVATAVYVIMTVTQFIPNLPINGVKVTDQNRAAIYQLRREMLPALKAGVILTTLAVEWGSIEAAVRGSMAPQFQATIFAPLALTLGVGIYYTIKMRAA